MADEYALWLELRDPVSADNGRQRLHEKFHDANPPLSIVSLGFQFGIKLDLAAVEKEIGRQIALNGGVTQDARDRPFCSGVQPEIPGGRC